MAELVRNHEHELEELEKKKYMKDKIPANSKYFDVRNNAMKSSFKELRQLK